MFMWQPDQIEKIAVMLKEGYSAGQIAPHFGKRRGAIIGIVQRNSTLKGIGFARSPGFNPKDRPRTVFNKAAQTVRAPKPKLVQARVEVVPSLPLGPEPIKAGRPASVGRPLSAIGAFQCHFAVNDAQRGEQHLFCGSPADGDRWCARHRQIVYRREAA